jgi:HSP20 family molecular chaperone IbpA
VGKRTLEIKAKMKRKINFKDFGITHRKGEFEFFRCRTRIPVPVDMKRMKKELKRDFLEVHLPRKKAIE